MQLFSKAACYLCTPICSITLRSSKSGSKGHWRNLHGHSTVTACSRWLAVDTEEVNASEDLLKRASTSGVAKDEAFDARAFRRSLNRTGR